MHKFGYAFCGDAAVVSSGREIAGARPMSWFEWGTKRFPLYPGSHVIGRDPDVEVRIDAPTVSRRHARIVVTPADGDDIRIGSQRITFP